MPDRTISTATAIASPPAESARKQTLFYAINTVLLLLTGVAMTMNRYATFGDALFIVALGLVCTLPLLYIRSFRGKYSLMLVFLAYYFFTFCTKDLLLLVSGQTVSPANSTALLSGGEAAILLGATCFIIGYLTLARSLSDHGPGLLSREWSPGMMLPMGVLLWAVGFYVTADWQFGFADRYSSAAKVAAPFGGFLSLFRMLQPLGSLVLIYLFLTSRRKTALLILIGTMLADFVLGFLGDSKEIAVRAPAMYIFSAVLLRERLPLVQSIAFVMAAGIAFSVFSSYREIVHLRNESRSDALQNIESRLNDISKQDRSLGDRFATGLDYFADRVTLKGMVELIVERTGKGVEFQGGRTIEPLLYVFIPRFLAPHKGDSSMAGLVFNREFHISADPDTYISMSHLGELYWNFGWPGLVIGMALIGALMALVAASVRLDTRSTLPRFLFLLMTIYMLSLRFESSIAGIYTLWARAAVLLLLISAVMPKQRAATAVSTP